ncbi:MAG: potassium/proton antiporter, partial [Tannerellaceae bacterium]|nr:potassium/proton antiporter [Tannerellaceae bacterium]
MFDNLHVLLQHSEAVLLIASVILFFSIFAGKAGFRFGLPSLLIFLGVGMLFGSDGLGIQFSSPDIAQFIGMLALTIILFSGGMDTKFTEVRPVLTQGVLLATLGVLITTVLGGLFTYYLFYWVKGSEVLTLAEAFLLTAVMASTDSASVFSILRGRKIHLKEKLHSVLELESGSNDPMAYLLTIMLISYIQQGDMSVGGAILSLVVGLAVGTIAGYLLGRMLVLLINKISLHNESYYPILLLAGAIFTFAATTLCEGNGYLAVYVTGLVVGNAKIVHKKRTKMFFEGFTWLFQIVMFLTLGLLVNPHELLPVAGIALGIGIFIIIFARPLSVFLTLLPFGNFSFKG